MNSRLRTVARSVVTTVNTSLAQIRLSRALAAAERPIKLEIGDMQKRPGWVVTNVNAAVRNYLDAASRWPLESGSVSYVYADNVIEHLPLEAGRAMLAEGYRCLQPGGVIRLVTPDVRKHVDLYLAGSSALDGPIGRAYRESGQVVEHPIDLLRIPIGSFGHHTGYVYDFDTLDLEPSAPVSTPSASMNSATATVPPCPASTCVLTRGAPRSPSRRFAQRSVGNLPDSRDSATSPASVPDSAGWSWSAIHLPCLR